jgi:hypothetical protein
MTLLNLNLLLEKSFFYPFSALFGNFKAKIKGNSLKKKDKNVYYQHVLELNFATIKASALSS